MENVLTLPLSKEQSADDVVINTELNEQTSGEMKRVIKEHEYIFSVLPGKTNVITCDLCCSRNQLVHVKQHPLPFAVHEDIEKELAEMVRLGVVDRSTSAYISPLVLVKKLDGSKRICVDFRRLNGVLVADAEPIPKMDATFAQVGRMKFISKLDLAIRYWQIPMSEESKEQTVFACGSGLFQFRFMPFRLKTAATTFTKLIWRVLEEAPNTKHYIEDVVVATTVGRNIQQRSEYFFNNYVLKSSQ